jgi:hypothetical protein
MATLSSRGIAAATPLKNGVKPSQDRAQARENGDGHAAAQETPVAASVRQRSPSIPPRPIPIGTAAVLTADHQRHDTTTNRLGGTADWNAVITVTLMIEDSAPIAMNAVSATHVDTVAASSRTPAATPPRHTRTNAACACIGVPEHDTGRDGTCQGADA